MAAFRFVSTNAYVDIVKTEVTLFLVNNCDPNPLRRFCINLGLLFDKRHILGGENSDENDQERTPPSVAVGF